MKISCPHCRQNYEVDESYAGQNVQCQNCGNEFSVNASPVVMLPTKTCPMCGEEILAVAKKCKYCGEYLNSDGTSAEKPKEFIIYFLLALFFGGLGIHNFYEGRYSYAIVKIVISAICWYDIVYISPLGYLGLLCNTLWILQEIFTFNSKYKLKEQAK